MENGTMISLEEAAAILVSHVKERRECEEIELEAALGRCAAQDLYAKVSQPPFARSPLDGYAVRAEDTKGASRENPVFLHIIDKIYAGEQSSCIVGRMEAVRLMTGSPIPKGADLVIRQEHVQCQGTQAVITREGKPFTNYCYVGEDFHQGDCLIQAGEQMDAIRIGIAAGMGYDKIPVKMVPKVTVLATGNELQEPGSELKPGRIYDTNRYVVSSRLRELGMQVAACKKVEDETTKIAGAVKEGIHTSDLIITTGGVSVGEKDLMPDVMEALGARILFHGVRVKPGSPVLAAYLNGKVILCLSGNPFGALVHLELLARPLLAKMSGDARLVLKEKKGRMVSPFPKKSPGRRMVRAVYEEGEVTVPDGLHASGVLGTMVGCNCLIDIEAGNPGLKKGDIVCVRMI